MQKTAFLLGKYSDRESPLFVMLPHGLEQWLGESGPRKLHKAGYGLAEAPLAWLKVLRETLLKCGFQPLTSDSCFFVLRGRAPPGSGLPKEYPHDYSDLPVLGVVGIHVDDLLCGGEGHGWEKALHHLTRSRRFGEGKYPLVLYCGVRLTQNLDTYAVKADQSDYVESIKDPINKRQGSCWRFEASGRQFDLAGTPDPTRSQL